MYDVIAVDDEQLLRGLLERVLAKTEWRTKVCADGAEALAVVRNEGVRVLLTDINMPRMTGVQLAREVHAIHPQLPVIAATASVEIESLESDDFVCVVSKPYVVSDLLRILTDCLAYARA